MEEVEKLLLIEIKKQASEVAQWAIKRQNAINRLRDTDCELTQNTDRLTRLKAELELLRKSFDFPEAVRQPYENSKDFQDTNQSPFKPDYQQ